MKINWGSYFLDPPSELSNEKKIVSVKEFISFGQIFLPDKTSLYSGVIEIHVLMQPPAGDSFLLLFDHYWGPKFSILLFLCALNAP